MSILCRPATGLAAVAMILGLAVPGAAQVSAADQVATLTKIFAFDRSLRDAPVTVVMVDSAEGARDDFAALRRAFEAEGITVRTTTSSDLAPQLDESSVVYFAPDAVTTEAVQAVAAAGALSIAPLSLLAEAGQVSVGIDTSGTRTAIVVSVPRLKEERHEFQSTLLRQPWVRLERQRRSATASELPRCRVTRAATPEYPANAQRLGVEGTVRLKVLVGADGLASEVEIIEAVRLLDRSAERTASNSIYAVEGWCELAVPFRLVE